MRALVALATVALAAAAVESNSAGARSGLRASSPTVTALLRSDTYAQELARTAQTVAETYFTDSKYGSYAGLTVAKAERIEPFLRGSTNAKLVSISGHSNSYRLTTRALLTRQTFSIAMGPSGKIKRRCTIGLECPAGVW
jgi:hypothetical protein